MLKIWAEMWPDYDQFPEQSIDWKTGILNWYDTEKFTGETVNEFLS